MRRPATLLLAAGVLLVVVLVATSGVLGGSDGHVLRAGFDDAIQMTPGQDVRVAGRKVGELTKVELVDGYAQVDLRIDDEDVWPLPKGTTARARGGSTTAYLGRYTELLPGPAGAGDLPEDGVLPRPRNDTAYELDQAYRIFRGRTKDDAGKAIDELGDTFDGRERALRKGLAAAPGGLDETTALMRELSADEERLSTLASAGDRTVSALAAREGDLRSLVTNAAGTFDELAQHTRAQQVALAKAPGTFRATNTTLARLDTSLDGLDGLVADLRTGAPALRAIARPTRTALAALRTVAPQANTALAAGTAAAPSLRTFFDTATPVMPRLGKALGSLAPMVSCIRPYAPEIAGFLTTWTGISKNYDAVGHYARTFPLTAVPAILPGTKNSSLDVTRTSRLRYAMPRPPGLNAGKPQFLPQCGAGPDALDPAKDPEGAGK